MNLANPETRRGLRSVVMAVVVLALLAMLWFWSATLTSDGRLELARWAMLIIGLSIAGYQFENGMRAFKLSAGPLQFEGQGNGKDGEA